MLGRGDNLEEIILENSEELIQAIEHQIRRKDEEGFSEYNHPMPNDFERDGGGDSDAVRDIVWGQVIEYFEAHVDGFTVTLRDGSEGILLCLRWRRALDPRIVEHFRRVVSVHYEIQSQGLPEQRLPETAQGQPMENADAATHVSLGPPPPVYPDARDFRDGSISSRYRASMPVGYASTGGGVNFGH